MSALNLTGKEHRLYPRVVSLADSLTIVADCRGYVLLVALSVYSIVVASVSRYKELLLRLSFVCYPNPRKEFLKVSHFLT